MSTYGGTICILLVHKQGKKKDKSLLKSSVSTVDVLAGTLLLHDWKRGPSSGPPCYILESLDTENVEVQCQYENEFTEIDREVHDLLLPVPTCQERLTVFLNKQWVNDGLYLKVGDAVETVVKGAPEDLYGILRYKGKVQGLKGTNFGVELVDNPGEGSSDGTFRNERYFHCPPDSAVFVAIHKIKRTKPRKDHGRKRQPEGAEAAYRSSEDSYHNTSHLKLGDRIIWMSDQGPEAGVVRWIGMLPDAKPNDDTTVGVEFDNPIGSGTGKYKDRRLFNAKQGHASLVPILGLMKEEEFYCIPSPVPDPMTFANEGSGNKTAHEVIEEQRRILDECNPQRKVFDSKYIDVNTKSSENISPRLSHEDNAPHLGKELTRNIASKFRNHSPGGDGFVTSQPGLEPVQTVVREEKDAFNPLYEYTRNKVAGELMEESSDMSSGSHARSQAMRRSLPKADPELEVGSLVEVMSSKPLYGYIKWIGNLPDQKEPKKLIAGLEMEEELSAGTDGTFASHRLFNCPPRKGFFVPLYKCRKDKRFSEESRRSRTDTNFGSIETPDLQGTVAPPNMIGDISVICGKNKGIQGHHNSCYLDATLLAMFYFTTVFDSILHRPKNNKDLPEYEEVKQVLKEGIVNPLRRYHYVRADKVMKLRQLLDKLGNISGMMSEEKDPEEFLNLLLNQITKADPFLHIRSGDNDELQHTYFYQLIMEKDERLVLPTTQQLFELSFLQMGIKLQEVPSCLIIQMPRFGKDYKMYKRILPSLELDITDVLENAPRECIICGELAAFECKECYQVHGAGLNTIAFCDGCKNRSHQHKQRKQHQPRQIRVPQGFKDWYTYQKATAGHQIGIPREKMELFAVICIQTSHYVSFVKCGQGKDAAWIFFDSMADRMGEQSGYNIPEVMHCQELPTWLSDEHYNDIIQSQDRNLPEHMRRLICDAYICLYQSPEVMMFK